VLYATIVWGLAYSVIYPSWPTLTGYYKGLIGYSSRGELAKDLDAVKQGRASWISRFEQSSVSEIAADNDLLTYAMAGGRAVFAENWGLVGVAAAMAAYLLVLMRLLKTAETSKDALGFFLCSGVFILVFSQAILGIGMAAGFLPVTGLPLPWMSYGGSSMLSFMAAMGLALSVRSRRFVN